MMLFMEIVSHLGGENMGFQFVARLGRTTAELGDFGLLILASDVVVILVSNMARKAIGDLTRWWGSSDSQR